MADEHDYWLSFVIKDERGGDGRAYGDRYEAVTSAVEYLASKRWEETTSFYLFRTSHSIDVICAHLSAAIDEAKDTVLIRRLDNATARIVGVFYDATLNDFLPYLRRG